MALWLFRIKMSIHLPTKWYNICALWIGLIMIWLAEWLRECVFVYTHACRVQRSVLCIFLYCFLFWVRVSPNLEFTNSVRLYLFSEHQCSCFYRPLTIACVHHHTWLFRMELESCTQGFIITQKHFINRAKSPVPMNWLLNLHNNYMLDVGFLGCPV